MSSRNAYTSDDERLLVKYIAKYNPQQAGRSGNALYKTLVENEQRKWSWSKRHTWQSWRDRYYKNKDSFDHKIRQHQKKHGIDASKPQKPFSSVRQKRARDDNDVDDNDHSEGEGAKDDRKRKRQRVEEVQRRAKIERERRENLKEEEEEVEEVKEDKGEGASRGGLSGKIMRHKPVSTAKRAQGEMQVANEGTMVKPKSGSASEKQHADAEGLDDGDDKDDEEENNAPVGSDDYEGNIFGSSDDEAEGVEVSELPDTHTGSETEEDMDAQEVGEQLITASDSESTTSSSRDELQARGGKDPSGGYEALYPAIESVPSPHLHERQHAESQIPGAYTASSSHPAPQPQISTTSKSALPPSVSLPDKPKSDPPTRRNPPAHAHARLQSRTLPTDNDFFSSIPSTPTPAPQNGKIPSSTARPRPPKLIEGPYGNSFVGARKNGGGGSDTESDSEPRRKKETWPPARRRTVSGIERNAEHESGKVIEREKILGESKVVDRRNAIDEGKDKDKAIDKGKGKERAIPATVDAETKASDKPVLPVPPAQRPRPPAQVNAQPSSSRILLSDMPPQPSSPVKGPTHSKSHFSDGRKVLTPSDANAVHVSQKRDKLVNGQPTGSDAHTKPPLSISSVTQNGKLKRQPSSLLQMSFPMPSESWTPDNPFIDLPQPPVLPQVESKEKRTGKTRDDSGRRHTIGTSPSPFEAASAGRRIDLREELARSTASIRMRQSLPLRSRTSSLRSTPDSIRIRTADADSSHLLALPTTDEDLATVQLLGVSRALSLIARNTSFSEEAVMKVWQAMGSIARTEEYFNRLKPVVGEVSERIYEVMQREEEQREKEGKKKLRDSASRPQVLGSSPERIDLEHRLSSPRRSANSERRDLNIQPFRQDDDDPMSDYSPPRSSRAGQYTRFVKQGRREEALKRQRQHASVGGIGEFIPREISDPKEMSQSPEVQEEEAEEVPRTRPPTVVVQTTAGVGAFDLELPANSQWGDEEEAAFMSASAKNADALRAIESRMPPEFMRKWTALHLIRLREKMG